MPSTSGNGNGWVRWMGGFIALAAVLIGFTEYRISAFRESLRELRESISAVSVASETKATNINDTVWKFNAKLSCLSERQAFMESKNGLPLNVCNGND